MKWSTCIKWHIPSLATPIMNRFYESSMTASREQLLVYVLYSEGHQSSYLIPDEVCIAMRHYKLDWQRINFSRKAWSITQPLSYASQICPRKNYSSFFQSYAMFMQTATSEHTSCRTMP